jgi:hypothetical protein
MGNKPDQDTDVDRLARSMLVVHGAHDDEPPRRSSPTTRTWSKSPDFAGDPRRAQAVLEDSRRDRERYLTAGLQPVECRFCHASVQVRKYAPNQTAVQWNSAASARCAHFSKLREEGGDPARERGCPRLADSVKHAIAEGILEPVSTAPPPGDG